jgi:hypothetical protein
MSQKVSKKFKNVTTIVCCFIYVYFIFVVLFNLVASSGCMSQLQEASDKVR